MTEAFFQGDLNMTTRTIITALLLLSTFGCCTSGHQSSLPQNPLWLGIADDVSGSVEESRLPVFTGDHLKDIVSILKIRGGAVAFDLIDEDAFQPLTRLELVRLAGRLDERARINQRNMSTEADFNATVEQKINRPRNARRTDIKGYLARFVLFFSEPTIPPGAEKVMLFISDGIDTGPRRRLSEIRLPEDVKIFAIGTEKTLAEKLFGNQAFLFESISAAIESLKTRQRS